ncbi:hypothetical protein P153DRAFT_355063 [Dothidotthia symphoricarpi CBS 119687]|uniref:Zn(2)-C6 fungal-type domain-containing protein n=1 Tax=Dothidotthia symphoricarpi CBS 119687 TaxID=1392245 RepID=A0A6A6ANI7_9PLEO|nr:uncharacterized protein P153DRAFT_355063 [Dothidotthia symphoricarpi CBS 119687]KAF2132457.1 hypothetical protein P153DRAFT_355063 [Dothidotthia symphoricarpi CBS 119687]
MSSSCIPTASQARLRNSCDACNTAKVKCSKEQPRCRRCERRGLFCVYSVSLRSCKRTAPNSTMATANRVVRRNSGNSQLNTTDSAHVPMDATYDFSSDVHMNLNLPALDDYFSASVLVDLPHSLGDDSILLTPQPQQQQHLHQQKHQQQHQFQHAHQGQNQVPSLSTSPTPSICACQQSILAKLSELSLASAGSSHVMPFDRALSANRSIVALCTSTLECSPCARGNDVMLLLTLAALLAHVLGVFDSLRDIDTRDHRGRRYTIACTTESG